MVVATTGTDPPPRQDGRGRTRRPRLRQGAGRTRGRDRLQVEDVLLFHDHSDPRPFLREKGEADDPRPCPLRSGSESSIWVRDTQWRRAPIKFVVVT